MKKLNLLSKAEMKNVIGGVVASSYCKWTFSDGRKDMNKIGMIGSNSDSIQAAADYICWEDDNCLDVDCPAR